VGNAVVDGLSISMEKVPTIYGLCDNCFREAHPQDVCPLPVIRRSLAGHKKLVAAILDKKKAQPLKFARVARGDGDDGDPVSDDDEPEYTAHAASSASAAACFLPPVPTFHYPEDEIDCENFLGKVVHRACYVCAVEPEIEAGIASEPEIKVEIEDEIETEIEVPEHAVPRARAARLRLPCSRAARLRQAFVNVMHGLAQGMTSAALAGVRHETAEFAHEAALAWDAAEACALNRALADRANGKLEILADVPDPCELELPINMGITTENRQLKGEIEAEIDVDAPEPPDPDNLAGRVAAMTEGYRSFTASLSPVSASALLAFDNDEPCVNVLAAFTRNNDGDESVGTESGFAMLALGLADMVSAVGLVGAGRAEALVPKLAEAPLLEEAPVPKLNEAPAALLEEAPVPQLLEASAALFEEAPIPKLNEAPLLKNALDPELAEAPVVLLENAPVPELAALEWDAAKAQVLDQAFSDHAS